MGKRSDFERIPRDFYRTPEKAVMPLRVHLPLSFKYCEPCAGDGELVKHMRNVRQRATCVAAYDIEARSPLYATSTMYDVKDALTLTEQDMRGADMIITNPPWDRKILHPMIEHFMTLVPDVWLLFDADWMHTKQAFNYLHKCDKIVSIGRVKWIENSKMTGKDNCCWYLFRYDKKNGETIRFYPNSS